MKRLILVVCAVMLLCGCRKANDMDDAMRLRSQLQNSEMCSFEATIVADYGDSAYRFVLSCAADSEGNMAFTVKEPEAISGITGKLSKDGGKLTFDDTALYFPMLAEGLITPVAAPWSFLTALAGGYVQSTGRDGAFSYVMIRDSLQDNAMAVEIWLDEENQPVQADVIWEDRRIVSMQIRNFVLA